MISPLFNVIGFQAPILCHQNPINSPRASRTNSSGLLCPKQSFSHQVLQQKFLLMHLPKDNVSLKVLRRLYPRNNSPPSSLAILDKHKLRPKGCKWGSKLNPLKMAYHSEIYKLWEDAKTKCVSG